MVTAPARQVRVRRMVERGLSQRPAPAVVRMSETADPTVHQVTPQPEPSEPLPPRPRRMQPKTKVTPAS